VIGLVGSSALWMTPRLSWRGSIGGAMLVAIVFAVVAINAGFQLGGILAQIGH